MNLVSPQHEMAMGFYNNVLLPRLLDHAMRNEDLVGYRQLVVGAAQDRVTTGVLVD